MENKIIIDLNKRSIKGYTKGSKGFKAQIANLKQMLKEETENITKEINKSKRILRK